MKSHLVLLGLASITTVLAAEIKQAVTSGDVTFTHHSCWSKGSGFDALTDDAWASNSMTVEKCADFCVDYSYFGVSQGRECYCGNTLGGEAHAATLCTTPCRGDSTEFCGGSQSFNMYKQQDSGGSVVSSYGQYTHQACWNDGTTGHALVDSGFRSSRMTVAKCGDFCEGYSYFGVGYGNKCFCGANADPSTEQAEAEECNLACTGDEDTVCGGAGKINLYKAPGVVSSSVEPSAVPSSSAPPAASSSAVPSAASSGVSSAAVSGGASSSVPVASSDIPSAASSASVAPSSGVSAAASSSTPSASAVSSAVSPAISPSASLAISSQAPSGVVSSSAAPVSSSTPGEEEEEEDEEDCDEVCDNDDEEDDDNIVPSVSSSVVPSSAVPSSVVPPSVVPSSVVPSSVAPSSVVPSSVAPSSVVPSAVVPSSAVPPSIAPSSSVPAASSPIPSSAIPVVSSSVAPSSAIPSGASSAPSAASSGTPSSEIPSGPSSAPAVASSGTPASSSVPTATSPTSTPPPYPDVQDYSFLNCYQETAPRLLAGAELASDDMTLDLCATFCAASSFPYFGTEYGRECFCAASLPESGLAAPALSECFMPCAANSTEICGGPNRISVYHNKDGKMDGPGNMEDGLGSSRLGCMTETGAGRTLAAKGFGDDAMSLGWCAAACVGYKYWGVEYGRECFCGNVIQELAETVGDGECNMVCAGNKGELCGAGNRIMVYERISD